MTTVPQVIRTKLAPPRQPARLLARPRLTRALGEAHHYRLTLLQAGAGYGKSTALSALSGPSGVLVWYQLSKEDSDPLVFLLHLCHATRLALPDLDGLPIPTLESWDGTRGPLPSRQVVDQYLNALHTGLPEPTLLVFDDAHIVAESPEIAHLFDRLIGLAPPDLHVLLAARPVLQLPNLARWQAHGEVLTIDQSVLAFTCAEISQLFAECYGYELTADEAETLQQATEGWAIALQMIWQSLRSGAAATVEQALNRQADSLRNLFEVLASEVFAQQPEDVQHFLRLSATLRVMTPAACNALLEQGDSAAMLAYLRRQELFVVDQEDGSLRYQYIFHHFLRQGASPLERRAWHLKAAAYFLTQSEPDSAIYHLLKAEDYPKAAGILEEYGVKLLAQGRLDTLAGYLGLLPPSALHQHPDLLCYWGDLARLHSRFQEALGWYQQAETIARERTLSGSVARALRGQARVYLDTVNPTRAETLLQQALRLSDRIDDREAQARLYEMLAENRLNAGQLEEAERLRREAQALRLDGPTDTHLTFRVLLRTGRLEEARRKLEAQVKAEQRDPVQVPRAHRETHLLLSLIYAFLGQAQSAYDSALAGTRRSLEFDSPFVTAVGHMRQGHALMLLPGPDRYAQARSQFEQAVEISHRLETPRLRVEALWGLCRAYGYQGDLTKAQLAADEAVQIATAAGDEWIASLVRLTMGAGLTMAGRYEMNGPWLNRASQGFRECSDPFGDAAARLWLCLGWHRQSETIRLESALPELMTECHLHGYDELLTRPTLLGVPDERAMVPLLVLARDQGWERAYTQQLLARLGLPRLALHPGYQLRVITLGAFQAWRGNQEIPATGWRREKTRQLFQLLLTYREAPLDREQIFEHLWPEAPLEVQARNFKVALSTLFNVLEPERAPGSESAYILREGSIYSLRPGADLWLDSQQFTRRLQQAESQADRDPHQAISLLEVALELYQGEYLPDARYESWAAAEREHLAVQFLRAADRLVELYLQGGDDDQAITLCDRILAQDNCWERAYRHLMQAYHRKGDRGQLARTYQHCQATLRAELEIDPAPETRTLFQRLTGSE